VNQCQWRIGSAAGQWLMLTCEKANAKENIVKAASKPTWHGISSGRESGYATGAGVAIMAYRPGVEGI